MRNNELDRARTLQSLTEKYSKVFNEMTPKEPEPQALAEVPKAVIQQVTVSDESVAKVLEYLKEIPDRVDAIISGIDSNPFPAEQKLEMTKNNLKNFRETVKKSYIQITKSNPWTP